MKKIIKLKESDLNKIVSRVIKEQGGAEGVGTGIKIGSRPASWKERTISVPVIMDASLFQNGIDKIDTSSEQFKKGVDSLRSATKNSPNLKVTVEGGASAVGSKEGYNNELLAKRRASNFIKSVQDMFPNVQFVVRTKVGTATVKNSPEAQAEQYVKLTYSQSSTTLENVPAIDNTAIVKNSIIPAIKELKPAPPTVEFILVCYEVPVTMVSLADATVKSLGGKKKS